MRIINRSKKLFALLFVFLFVAFNTGLVQVFASSNLTSDEQDKIDSYKSQQESLKTKIAENQEKMDALKDDIEQQANYVATLQEQIDNYQDQINLLNDSINVLESQKGEIQTEIDKLSEQIDGIKDEINHNELQQIALQQEVDDIKDELKERLCNIYMYGKTSELELLLNSTDFKSFLITMELSSNIAKHDNQIVTDLKDKVKEFDVLNAQHNKLIEQIEEKQAEHQVQIDALDVKENDIKSSRADLQSSQDEILALQEEASKYLNELDQESAAYKALIAQYEADMEEFDAMIDDIIAEAEARRRAEENGYSGGYSSSGFIWPLQYSDVYISSGYGYRSDPATGVTKFHGGCDTCRWSGTYGASISASASGVVLTAAYMASGYGYYVLLDHGNGIYTLYGHNSQLLVSTGEYVSQGQTIAYAGATGYATGAHCHFEVRVNGTRVDPLGYASP
ncbi:MAG: peptidoglycan DD-metalloendopeptidase family protein [Clostridia bacterium]|nr:peptidoglycan DD-metalloendopeptidase family protein [Clostridia bacterium]MBQ9506228.1 peptidoglycan DD-metalloendopeptidase family protein [Clostridia bacterium]